MEDNNVPVIRLREDFVLEIELPDQNKFYQIPLRASDYIVLVKEKDKLALVLNNQGQISLIPDSLYNSVQDFLKRAFDESFIDYKMKTMSIKPGANVNRNAINNNDLEEHIDNVDVFVNHHFGNIISIAYEGKNDDKITISVKDKGSIVIYK